MSVSRQICSLSRIFARTSTLGTRGLTNCGDNRRCITRRAHLPSAPTATFPSGIAPWPTPSSIAVTEEPDTLFQTVSVLVKGHDRAVLDSYEFFATLAAEELGVTLREVFEPPKNIERLTLLKSIHIFKKHRVQYEMRTHFRRVELARVTGSTARVYLEYIQRNLPEGVAMEVSKTAMEKIPEHILEPMWKDQPTDKNSSLSEQS